MAAGHEGSLLLGDRWFLDSQNYASQEIEEKEMLDDTIDESAVRSGMESIDFEVSDMEDQTMDNKENTATNVTDGKAIVFSGLCRLCCTHGSSMFSNNDMASSLEECLPYATSCFKGFQQLMTSLPIGCVDLKQAILYENMETLLNFARSAQNSKTPPVLVAESIGCIGSCFWTDMGPVLGNAKMDVSQLLAFLRDMGENVGGAWTVRAAAFRCIATLAEHCHENSYQQPRVGQSMIEACREALKDRKFWRVR
jgi:hypothetical protein